MVKQRNRLQQIHDLLQHLKRFWMHPFGSNATTVPLEHPLAPVRLLQDRGRNFVGLFGRLVLPQFWPSMGPRSKCVQGMQRRAVLFAWKRCA